MAEAPVGDAQDIASAASKHDFIVAIAHWLCEGKRAGLSRRPDALTVLLIHQGPSRTIVRPEHLQARSSTQSSTSSVYRELGRQRRQVKKNRECRGEQPPAQSWGRLHATID
jgi:hypothetical protein